MIRELELRRAKVLRELSMLSEAKAAGIVAFSAHAKPQGSPPPGVVLDRKAPPSKDEDLAGWYQRMFDRHATNEHRTFALCLQAERDLWVRCHGASPSRNMLTANRATSDEEREAQERFVIDAYEGVHALEVSYLEEVPGGWVETVRERHGRRPVDGVAASDWQHHSDEVKAKLVTDLRDGEKTQKQAARALRVSVKTVQRFWQGVPE